MVIEDLMSKVKDISKQNPFLCMQCGTCSASCTGMGVMQQLPRMLMRMLQMSSEKVLNSPSFWQCTACLACSVRCPRGIDVGRVMEALRVINLRKGNQVLVQENIPPDLLAEVPQMALTSGFRKLSA